MPDLKTRDLNSVNFIHQFLVLKTSCNCIWPTTDLMKKLYIMARIVLYLANKTAGAIPPKVLDRYLDMLP